MVRKGFGAWASRDPVSIGCQVMNDSQHAQHVFMLILKLFKLAKYVFLESIPQQV
jgi:hypothetical protein